MAKPTAEILSQGNEITHGRITDSNAGWLSTRLTEMGFWVTRHSAVPDHPNLLMEVLKEISTRCDLCISTGGLGPTVDDLTAQSVSEAFGLDLVLDPEALREIESKFQQRSRIMPESNRRQALLPKGARRLDNLWGTAPGFSIEGSRAKFYFLPGVPKEMQRMFETWVIPSLNAYFGVLKKTETWVFQTVGVGESALEEKLSNLPHPTGTHLGFRAKGMENEVKVSLPPSVGKNLTHTHLHEVEAILGDCVFAVQPEGKGSQSIAEFLGKHLRSTKSKVYVEEALSSGHLSLSLAQQGVLLKAEIHPLPSPSLSIENDEVLQHELESHAQKLLYQQHADVILLERWLQIGKDDRGEQMEAVLWTAGGTKDRFLIRKRNLYGSLDQIQKSASIVSLDTLRHLLNLERETCVLSSMS